MAAEEYTIPLADRALRLLLVDWEEHVSPVHLADFLYERKRHELSVADVVIVRPCVYRPIPDPAALVPELQPLFERVAKLPAYLLTSSNFTIDLSQNLHPDVDDILSANDREAVLGALPHAELAALVQRTGAIFQADGSTVFRAPSQKYCRRFLRAGNVQTSRCTLDVIFFWLLPWLRECRGILVDSWSISSIALNAAHLLSRYAPNTPPCDVEMLPQYLDGSAEADHETREVLNRVGHAAATGSVLALFSACMTGVSVERLRRTVEDHLPGSGSAFRVRTLFALHPGLPVEALCQLHRIGEDPFRHMDELPTNEGQLTVIDIDPTTYFPVRVVEEAVQISQASAREARSFFDDYHGSGAMFVHRNSYLGGKKFRHHAIYPDVGVLLAHPLFQTRVREAVASLDPLPGLIVTPPHDAGARLAEFTAGVLRQCGARDVEVLVHVDLNFGRTPTPVEARLRDALAAVGEGASVLVVDDVAVTGGRLSRYSRSLRDLYRGRIHYFVGIARPQSQDRWEKLKRDLRYRSGREQQHTVTHVEFILLPDWDERECPWCHEEAVYRRITLSRDGLPAVLTDRVAALSAGRIDQGICPALFLNPTADVHPMRMAPNSIFVREGATEVELFVAVASALQHLRTDPRLPRRLARSNYPLARRLDPTDYLGNTFTDPIIRAAILRASRRYELEHVTAHGEAQRSELAAALLLSDAPIDQCVAWEFALASAARKLPDLTRQVIELRRSPKAWHDVFELLAEGR